MIEDNDIIKDGKNDDDQSKYWYLWVFYFNPKDKRIFVPKHYGFGWTINFANPFSGLIFLVLIFVVFYNWRHHK